jgi:hypothetical protein
LFFLDNLLVKIGIKLCMIQLVTLVIIVFHQIVAQVYFYIKVYNVIYHLLF